MSNIDPIQHMQDAINQQAAIVAATYRLVAKE